MQQAEALEKLARFFADGSIGSLRALGSELAEEAFLENSRELVDLAVLAYVLAKFLEKHYITESKQWQAFAQLAQQKLQLAAKAAGEGKHAEADQAIDSLLEDVESLSSSLGRFQTSVLTKARVKIATDAYAHGASLGRACDFAGVDKKLVLSYIGVTRLSDKYETIRVSERLAKARELFE